MSLIITLMSPKILLMSSTYVKYFHSEVFQLIPSLTSRFGLEYLPYLKIISHMSEIEGYDIAR